MRSLRLDLFTFMNVRTNVHNRYDQRFRKGVCLTCQLFLFNENLSYEKQKSILELPKCLEFISIVYFL